MKLTKVRKHLAKHWNLYVLFILVLVSFFLRFYNYPFRYGLGDETVRDAVVGIVGAKEVQFPLTGPFSSAGPFTFGPWYYYQLIFANLILDTNYASWIYLSLLSLLCILLLYKIGAIFSKTFGVLLAFLGTISSSLLLAGTHLTNPNLSNFFAFLAVYLFLKHVKKNLSNWWGMALGIALGISVNIHYQMIGLLILPILLFVIKPRRFLNFISIVFGFVVTFLPLIFFDLNNHWFNFKNLLYYYTEGKNLIYVPNRWLFYLRDFWPSYVEDVTGLPPFIAIISFVLFSGVVAYNLYKRNLSKELLLLLVAFLFNFILLRYYWGERFFGYLNYMRPFVIIFEGYVIYSLYQIIKWKNLRYLYVGLVLLLLMLINLPKVHKLMERDVFTVHMHKIQEKLVKNYPNRKFSLFICPGPGNTYYSSQSHSLLFLLDKDSMLSENGLPIAFENEACLPTGLMVEHKDNYQQNNFIKVDDTGLIDLSKHTSASISAMKWEKHSVEAIHDNVVRWWFNEQP